MKSFLVFSMLLLLASVAPAQDPDLEFAEMLAREGYDDLAEDLPKDIAESALRPENERALGRYMLARLAKIRAERERLIDQKIALIDAATARLDDELRRAADGEPTWRALGDVADLYALKGWTLARKAEADASSFLIDDAAVAYETAERRYEAIIARIAASGAAGESAERMSMLARFRQIVATFDRATLYAGVDETSGKMTDLLEATDKLCDAFMWDFDGRGFLSVYDLGIYRGRANALLAERATSETAREGYYAKAFGGLAFRLATIALPATAEKEGALKDPVHPLYEQIRTIVADGFLHQMTAGIGRGDRAGREGVLYYRAAVDDGERALALYPDARGEETFLRIRFALGRAYAKLAMDDRAERILRPLTTDPLVPPSLVRAAGKLLEELGGSIPFARRLEIAEAMERQGDVDRALEEYQRLFADAATPERERSAPLIMHRIAGCYLAMGRLFEALTAFAIFDTPEGTRHGDYAEAMDKRVRTANRVASMTGDPADAAEYDRLRKIMIKRGIAGAALRLIEADALMQRKEYRKAANLYATIGPGDRDYEEALFHLGLCYYLPGRALAALETPAQREEGVAMLLVARPLFDRHLTTTIESVAETNARDLKRRHRVEMSILALTEICVADDPRLRDPRKALLYAERIDRVPHPSVDRVVPIYGMKIRAGVALERFDVAEEALHLLEEKYPHRKSAIGEGRFTLARAYDAKAKALEKSDPAASGEYLRKANERYVTWVRGEDDARVAPMTLRILGDRLLDEARRFQDGTAYAWALEMYVRFDRRMKAPAKYGLTPMTAEEEKQFLRILAECHGRAGTGNLADAHRILTIDLRAGEPDAPIDLQIQLAELCLRRAEVEREKSLARAGYLREACDLYGRAAARVNAVVSEDHTMAGKSADERRELWTMFWTWLYEHASILYRLREYERVENLIEQYRGFYPDLGGEPHASKFRELQRHNEEDLRKERVK